MIDYSDPVVMAKEAEGYRRINSSGFDYTEPEPELDLNDRRVIRFRPENPQNMPDIDWSERHIYEYKGVKYSAFSLADLTRRVANLIGADYEALEVCSPAYIFNKAEALKLLGPDILFDQEEESMGVMHTTKEGKKIPIYRMEDEHLLRTIAYFSIKLMDAYNDTVGAGSLLDEVMNGSDGRKNSVDSLKTEISKGYDYIGRFVLEAVRRGLGPQAKERLLPFDSVMKSLDTFQRPGTATLPKSLDLKTHDDLTF